MKKKIDLRAVFTDPLHAGMIAVYIVVVMMIVIPVQHAIMVRSSAGWWYATLNTIMPPLLPPEVAVSAEIEEAVHRIQGWDHHGAWRSVVTSMMSTMVISYLVGPSLFVWGLRARARAREHAAGWVRTTAIAVALAFGGGSVIALLPSVLNAYQFHRAHEETVSNVAKGKAGDRLSDELFMMANRAQVAYFVPENPGEQAGSWQCTDGSARPVLSIARLIPPGTEASMIDARHAVIGDMSYELVIETPDSLTIRGKCMASISEVTGDNAPSDSVRSGLLLGVTPDCVTMISWK